MKFQPFGELVLVELQDKRKDVKKVTGIYLPETSRQKWWTVKILAVGIHVTLDIAEGDICLANPVSEVDDRSLLGGENYRLMHSSHLLGKIQK